MKLRCLSKGGGFHFPACHILDICGFRILLECPIDLSAMAVFSPITAVLDDADVELINAVPWYKTVRNFPISDLEASLVDLVVVSTPSGMLGLPFLTRTKRFSAKVYTTEVTARLGKMAMEELVEMHGEFVRVYGLEEDGSSPEWMGLEELQKLPSALREIVMGGNGEDLRSWVPLYSAEDISECMKKVCGLKYAEESCYNGALILKPFSSGLEIGASNWKISGPRRSVTYLTSSLFTSSHAANFDYRSLQGNDVILFSDFSPLHENQSFKDNENMCEDQIGLENKNSSSVACPAVRRISDDSVDFTESADVVSETLDEEEKMCFMCSCVIDSVKRSGSVLIPIGQIGVMLRLLEQISKSLKSSNLEVPLYMVSPVAEEKMAYVNFVPEWLSEGHRQKLFSGEPLFSHAELIEEKKLKLFPDIHSSNVPMEWREPCIVFCPHWSLRSGPVVHLLHLWHANKDCLLILEQGIDADVALSPFKPVALKVLQCSFLSGITITKISPLLNILHPRLVLFPEDLKRLILSKETTISSSFLFYTDNMTLNVPKVNDYFEAYMSIELASQLQPRKLQQQNLAISRSRAQLSLRGGKFFLGSSRTPDKPSSRRIHWGSVDHKLLLTALQEKGIVVDHDASSSSSSIHKIDNDIDHSTTGCEVYHLKNVNGSEPFELHVSDSETLITGHADETLVTIICEALSSASDGI